MNKIGLLIFFCGKMGAGKTTASNQIAIERNAILISEDQWLANLYPDQIKSFEDYIQYSRKIKPLIKDHVQNLLKIGVTVVMDFPANTAVQRKWFLDLANEVKAHHHLYYLNVADEVCLAQLAKRRVLQPARAIFDTPEVFVQVNAYFQKPTSIEGLNIQV